MNTFTFQQSIIDTLVQVSQLHGILSDCDKNIRFKAVGKVKQEIKNLRGQNLPRYNPLIARQKADILEIALSRAQKGNFRAKDIDHISV